MVIAKILNNNVVVTLDENNREQIVMGRGIAFKKKCGESVAEENIDKIFKLSSKDAVSRLQELMQEIPMDHMKLSDDIILYAKTHMSKKLNENIYISLTDHIYTAMQRFKDGIAVKNVLLYEIKRFYRDEYQIGLKALNMIEERFGVRLPDDEAGFIAFHFVNAAMEEQTDKMFEITKVMQEITNIVKYHFNLVFQEESVYYFRFINHLKFFALRLVNGHEFEEEQNDDLLDIIKVKYHNAYCCVLKVTGFIEEKYQYHVSDEEQVYLTIHIARVTSKGIS